MAVFVAAIALLAFFWMSLPSEIKDMAFRPGRPRLFRLPVVMFGGWIAGWFLLLFVRAEDLHVRSPFDYEALKRVVAAVLILIAAAIAVFYAFSFVA